MAAPQFYETVYGKRFFEMQLPKLIKEIGRLAFAIEESNELRKKALTEAKEDQA